MRLAQRNHPAAPMPDDDGARAGNPISPEREAQVADESEPLRVAEGCPESEFVLDDAPPERDGAENRWGTRPTKGVRVQQGMQPAGAPELRHGVGPAAAARSHRGPSWRPRFAITGDRQQTNLGGVAAPRQGPDAPRMDRLNPAHERGIERADERHPGAGSAGSGGAGSGSRGPGSRSGTVSGNGNETGSISMIRLGGPISTPCPSGCRPPQPRRLRALRLPPSTAVSARPG